MTTRRTDGTLRTITMTGSALVLVAACATASPSPSPTLGSETARPSPVASATSSAAPSTSPGPSLGTVPLPGEAWIASQANFGIRLVRPDGSGGHTAFPLVPGGEQLHPDWSPDGEWLSFTVRGETDEIWVGRADGSETRKVVPCQDPCAWADEAAWSPDGTTLLFQRMRVGDAAGESTLELLDVATGATEVILTAPSARAFYQPRWSPDGTRVVTEFVEMAGTAFDSDVVGVALAIVDLTASPAALRELTTAADLTNSPDWSRATDLIVYAQPTSADGFDGPSDLVTIHPDGTGRTVVTAVGPRDGQTPQPAWSPDGSRIVFVLPDSSMATIGVDGTGQAPAVAGDITAGLHPRYRPVP